MHPCLPILDLEALRLCLLTPDSMTGFDSVVFYAMVLAVSPHLGDSETKSLSSEGLLTDPESYVDQIEGLYQKTHDSLEILKTQTALLVSYSFWNRLLSSESTFWHRRAVTHAERAGIFDHADFVDGMHVMAHRMRRRLAWACYIRDRLNALLFHHPLLLDQQHFNVTKLEISDFQESIPPPDMITLAAEDRAGTHPYHSCMRLADLCVRITTIINLRETVLKHAGGTDTLTLALHLLRQKMVECDRSLSAWYAGEAEQVCRPSKRHLDHGTPGHEDEQLHVCMLICTYLTALTTMFHTALAVKDESQRLFLVRARAAARLQTKIFRDLSAQNLLHKLPVIGVLYMVPAVSLLSRDLQNQDKTLRSDSRVMLTQILRILRTVEKGQPAAAAIARWTNEALVAAWLGELIPGFGRLPCDSG